MSGRNPSSYCTLTLIAMQGHQQKGRQTNTSSNNKDTSDTIIETSTAEDHDDENLHNPSTRPRYSPRVTSHTILTRTIFSCMSFIPNCRAGFISSLNLLAERTPAPFYQSLLQSSCRAGLYDCTLVSIKMI